jgi:ribose 5-phosphate isomerase B
VQTKIQRLGFGADDAGLALKDFLFNKLAESPNDYLLTDYGVYASEDSTAYPEIGLRVAEAVARGELDRAILICGTGLGMAISANKVRGVRAAVAYDAYSVERSILSNNCQVLALGSRVVGPELGLMISRQWLSLHFDQESNSARKVKILTEYESVHDGRSAAGGQDVQ